MFRKVFIVIFLLIAGCVGWMLITSIAPQSQPHIKTTALWAVNTTVSEFNQLVFEADGKTLISVDAEIKKWDVATKKLKSTSPRQGHSWRQFSADGKYYAYGASIRSRYDSSNKSRNIIWNKVILHDAQSKAPIHTFNFPNVDIRFDEQAVFSNNSRLLNFNYSRYQTHPNKPYDTYTDVFTVWDTQSGKQIHSHIRKVSEDTDPFFINTQRHLYQDPIFSPDNKQLWLLEPTPRVLGKPFETNGPRKIYLTDLMGHKTAAVFSLLPEKHHSFFNTFFVNDKWIFLSASSKEPLIAALNNGGPISTEGGILCGFNVKTQQILWHREADNFSTQALAFSPDGKFLAWGGSEIRRHSILGSFHDLGRVFLLDPKTGETIAEVTERTLSDFAKRKQIEFLAPLKRALGLKSQSYPLPGETLNVESLAFSPDSKKLAVGYRGGTIKLWKIQ